MTRVTLAFSDRNVDFIQVVNTADQSLDASDEQDIRQIEQKSIMLALRSSIAPSLCGADAAMFATLLSDYFPSVEVPLVFDQDVESENNLSIGDDTIGIARQNEEGSPFRSLPNSPKSKDHGRRSSLQSTLSILSNKGRFCNNSEVDTLISKRLSVENKSKLSQLTRADFVTILKLTH